MHEFLLIESGDSQADADRFLDDASCLASRGDDVVLLLIENGVVGAVPDALPGLNGFLRRGGDLWVDSFSLRQRAVCPDDLVTGARVVEMDHVAEALLKPRLRVVWH